MEMIEMCLMVEKVAIKVYIFGKNVCKRSKPMSDWFVLTQFYSFFSSLSLVYGLDFRFLFLAFNGNAKADHTDDVVATHKHQAVSM